ncbi:CBS domain-containing protein [Marinigracilibium pacificum]|uniref:CBS domain-containing protein n=1 Tax=Marinigracilibium pacificum TaxID=2729599 RepID=A0A848J266_9BACT|nr:CBS domain-containing protein [Marinigracilibium pacificum]NMM48574.1 CBS domain-containing protein [Marinigracilibium pacificum]
MGEHSVKSISDGNLRTQYIKRLLEDIELLDQLIMLDSFENDVVRIGAEQEFCLINDQWKPANNSLDVLKDINDSHFTTELARYNLEINLDPLVFENNCFSTLENNLKSHLKKAGKAAKKNGSKVLLTGILPTISRKELQMDYMTPIPRYYLLNEVVKAIRGTDFSFHIMGVDELTFIHDSVLFEACNTSFQMHLQISSDDFISAYNWSQAIAGPVLGICANSPLLLGRELWFETRVALFMQSVDTRSSSYALRDQDARVSFGDSWAQGTVTDIFKKNISKYKVLLTKELEANIYGKMNNKLKDIPKLEALSLHNSTIYPWNRPCYGVGGGKPHLRIENRYIPAGPTIVDEIANFAFWAGLMKGRPEKYNDMLSQMDFRDAKSNFIRAARTGKESVMRWEGDYKSVRQLIINDFLPIAYSGLEKMNIDKGDIDKYLGIIEQRTSGRSAAQWMIKNYRNLKENLKVDDALMALTKSIYKNQQKDIPVHNWKTPKPIPTIHESSKYAGHIMSTQLFTVNENDPAEFALKIMEWNDIHHLPVEDLSGNLIGVLNQSFIDYVENTADDLSSTKVQDIMSDEFMTVDIHTPIKDVISIIQNQELTCLPVVEKQQLVGIITLNDIKRLNYGGIV